MISINKHFLRQKSDCGAFQMLIFKLEKTSLQVILLINKYLLRLAHGLSLGEKRTAVVRKITS